MNFYSVCDSEAVVAILCNYACVRDDEGNESKRSRDDGSDDETSIGLGVRVTSVSTATPMQDFQAMIQQKPHNFLESRLSIVTINLNMLMFSYLLE